MPETVLGTAAVVPRGPYDANAEYKRANVVYQDGRAYMALLPSKGIPVSNALHWMLLVEPSPAPVAFGSAFPDDAHTVMLVNTQGPGIYVEDLPARRGGTLGARMDAIDETVMLTDNNRALTEQYKNEANQYRLEAVEKADAAEADRAAARASAESAALHEGAAQEAAQGVAEALAGHDADPSSHAARFADYYTKGQIDAMLAALGGEGGGPNE